jgi:hypothetical protein
MYKNVQIFKQNFKQVTNKPKKDKHKIRISFLCDKMHHQWRIFEDLSTPKNEDFVRGLETSAPITNFSRSPVSEKQKPQLHSCENLVTRKKVLTVTDKHGHKLSLRCTKVPSAILQTQTQFWITIQLHNENSSLYNYIQADQTHLKMLMFFPLLRKCSDWQIMW